MGPYIKELITTNECIILPNFGGLETWYTPAKFDPVNKRMLPPSKRIVFKPEYTKGGEVLENYICTKLGVKQSKAKTLVANYVSEISNRLESQKKVELSELGTFITDINGQVTFEAYEEVNYLVDSFGLEPLAIKEVTSEPSPQHADNKPKIHLRPRANTLVFVITGIGLISLLVALTVFISSRFDLYLFNIGDTSIENDKIVLGGTYELDETRKELATQIDATTLTKTALQYIEDETNINGHNDSVKTPSTYYIIIVGSYKTYSNAKNAKLRMINDGFDAEIIEASGLYRTSIGRFTDINYAKSELNRIKNQLNRSVWLLSVKEE